MLFRDVIAVYSDDLVWNKYTWVKMQVHIFNVRVGGVYSNHSDLQAEPVNMPVSEYLFLW